MSLQHAICCFFLFLSLPLLFAQSSFDVQLFRPSPHGDAFFSVESGAISPDLLQATAFFNYAYRPLELVSTANDTRQSGQDCCSDHLVDADFMVLGRALSPAVRSPSLFPRRCTKAARGPVVGKLPPVNFRDLAFDAKVGLLDVTARFYIDVAASIGLSVPTGNTKAFSGDKTEIHFLSRARHLAKNPGPVRLAGNGGYLWRYNH